MGSLERRIENLAERIGPPENPGAELARKKRIKALNDLASLLWQEGEAINSRMAVLEAQGLSYRDAQTVAKDEIVRARNPELATFLDESFSPEIRHDPIAKREWLGNYIESRKR